MTNEEIKADCDAQYKALRKAEDRLKELRATCPHENTFEGLWSWRPGTQDPAIICKDCGVCLQLIQTYIPIITTTNYE